ncbi:MAG TPA: hypothetical protein ENI55_01520 [Alphaproteobacteria bacterium]|nr:hypothetical protein [Alphaproteobacteria bacterium]
MAASKPQPLPFKEAIDLYRSKVRLPTRRWTDLWQGMHARAFVIAGATKDALIADFQSAVQKAIEKGTTLAEFRKDFDRIVAAHGWSYRGTRGWRSRVIFNTNVRMAHAAGRWAQIQRLKDKRPYLRYVAVLDSRTRPLHRAWHGTTLAADDAWWKTHYPPNGWYCRCTVQTLSERDMKRFGYPLSAKAPPLRPLARRINSSAGPVSITVPEGIDPGFAYNPGEAAWGSTISEQAMAAWRQSGGRKWRRLTGGDWRSAGRPEMIPLDTPDIKIGAPPRTMAAIETAIEASIGGAEKIFTLPDGGPLLVNAATLAKHIGPARGALAALLPELIKNPFEIWATFERHRATGQVVLRKRLVKAVRLDKDRAALLVAQAAEGRFEAWTVLTTRDWSYIQRQRSGHLVWARK